MRRAILQPPVPAIALYALVAMGMLVAAYFTIFTVFAPYDDEGTLLVTLQSFVRGHVLYRDIYSEYGPFYYELFGAFFKLTGADVTNDASRLIVIVLWVGTSLSLGVAAQRLTGRLLLGLSATMAAFATLFVLVNEPMHPQGLCVLLLGGFTLLVVFGPGHRRIWFGAAAGALLAALVMTKLNLGVFAVAATVLAATLTMAPLQRRRWILWPVAAAAIAMPLLVAARDIHVDWVRDMIAFQTLAMAAVVVAAWPSAWRHRPGGEDGGAWRWLLGASAGFAVAFVAILVAILFTGVTLADVYSGVVTEAMRVRDVVLNQFPMSPAVVDWGLAALAAAVLSLLLRLGEGEEPTLWPGLLRLVVGITIWWTVARITPVSVGPTAGNQVSLPGILAWVAVVPPAGVVESQYKRFLRVLLPALAVAEMLQVYPVAGSQVGISALMYVSVGALCLGDGLVCLRRWAAARGGLPLQRFGVIVAVGLTALAVDFGINSVARPAANGAVLYHDQKALPFAGARLLHLPESDENTYAWIIDLVHRYHCTNFIGYPNIDSFYLWAGIEPPAPAAPGAWIEAMDDEKQQRVVDELRATPRPCAIRSNQRAGLWLGGDPVPDAPLVNYVLHDFHPVGEMGEFQFMLPNEPNHQG